jgi:polyhydroxyalkanoate synthesis regulator phasin
MRRSDRIADLVRRQQAKQQRLDQQQRFIMQVGGQRLDILDEQMSAIQTNTGRIAALEEQIAELRALVDAHNAEPAGKAHK